MPIALRAVNTSTPLSRSDIRHGRVKRVFVDEADEEAVGDSFVTPPFPSAVESHPSFDPSGAKSEKPVPKAPRLRNRPMGGFLGDAIRKR